MNNVAPHKCVECGEPAYLPFSGGCRCTNMRCQHWDQDLWVEAIMSEPDPGDPEEELDIDEEAATEPRGLAAWLPEEATLDTGARLKFPTVDDIKKISDYFENSNGLLTKYN